MPRRPRLTSISTHPIHPPTSGVTNEDGRVETLLPTTHALQPGVYRLTFDTAGYFRSVGSKSFYPEVGGVLWWVVGVGVFDRSVHDDDDDDGISLMLLTFTFTCNCTHR